MFPFTTALLLACLLVLALAALHKLRRMHLLLFALQDQARAEAGALFRQLEALQGLYAELGIGKSLPATRGWAASPDFLLALARHALQERPRTVVECSSGVSTVVLARCMQINGAGMVYSLEHDALYAQATRAELERHGLAGFATVLVAPLRMLDIGAAQWPWYAHEALPASLAIDLLAIDGPPMDSGALARYPAGPALFHRLAPNAAVFLDDAGRAAESAILQRWNNEFPQLSQTLLACEKGCAVLRRDA
jgi:predicted O-methyltransferase YrrM